MSTALRTPRPGWLAICTALVLAGAAMAAMAAGAAMDQDGELQALMGMLAQRPHGSARFQQSQYLAALTRPLLSAGTLSYDAPDHLEQHIDTPRPQQLVLEHGQLTLQVGRHRRSVRLADYPQLAPLLESIRAMLAGDLPALQHNFRLQLSGPLGGWSLLLTPRDAALASTLRALRMRGDGAQIREVQIEQTNGDHAVMHIEPLS
jgi:hypothetical protein